MNFVNKTQVKSLVYSAEGIKKLAKMYFQILSINIFAPSYFTGTSFYTSHLSTQLF